MASPALNFVTHPTPLRASPVPGGSRPAARVAIVVVAVAAFIGLAIAKPWDAPTTTPSAFAATQQLATAAASGSLPAPTRTPTPTPSSPSAGGFSLAPPPDPATAWTGLRWTQLKPADPLNLVASVMRWRGGFVAVGWDMSTRVPSTPLWSSTDGREWVPLSGSGGAPFWPGLAVVAAGAVRGDLVAITRLGDPSYCTGGPTCLPEMAWTSADGRHWDPHDGPDLGLAVGSGPPLVTFGPAGALAVSSGRHARAAVSRDGVHWQDLPAATIPADFGVDTLAAAATGYVLGGAVSSDGAPGRAAAAWSADGRTWTVTPALPSPDLSAGPASLAAWGSLVTGFAIGRDGVVALGQLGDAPGAPLWWQSDDGRRWRFAAGTPPLGPAYASIAGDGRQIIASRGGPDPGAWASTDGWTWRRLAIDGDLPTDLARRIVLLPGGVLATDGGTTWYGAATAG